MPAPMSELHSLCPYSAAQPSNRRIFLKRAGLVALLGIIGFPLAGCDSTSGGEDDSGNNGEPDPAANGIVATASRITIDLSKVETLKQAGNYLILLDEDGHSVHVIIINVDGSQFRAFSSICTHAGCDVARYRASTQRIQCDCHGSEFDINGQPVSGPAPSPLPAFSVSRSGDMLTIQLSAGKLPT